MSPLFRTLWNLEKRAQRNKRYGPRPCDQAFRPDLGVAALAVDDDVARPPERSVEPIATVQAVEVLAKRSIPFEQNVASAVAIKTVRPLASDQEVVTTSAPQDVRSRPAVKGIAGVAA